MRNKQRTVISLFLRGSSSSVHIDLKYTGAIAQRQRATTKLAWQPIHPVESHPTKAMEIEC